MKKGLSLLVAFALVFSLFSSVAFAATTPSEAGQKLKSLGIILGDQNGDLMMDANWKRQDVAVLLSRLLGQEDEAKNHPKTHTYTDVRGDYYDGYLSWARDNGYMIGRSDTEFGFDDPITVKDFVLVILRALGYDPEYSEVEELAVEVGLVEEGTDFSANATRGDTYVIIVTALDTEVAGTGQKLGTVLGLPGYEVTVGSVTGVSALNLKQVRVTFSKPVDEDTAKTVGAYKVYNANESNNLAANGSVELQNGGTVAVISLNGQLKNGQSAAKIVVDGVKDADGNAIPKFEGTFSVLDNTVPTVVGVKSVGPRQIQVEFSEPVKLGADPEANFSVDNGNYYITDAALDGLTKVNVEVGLDLTEGEHTLTVNSQNLYDYADYKPVPVTVTFNHVKDTTAPTVTVKSVSPEAVTLEFNKPVNGLVGNGNVLIRHTYNNPTYQVAGDSGFVTGGGSEYTIKFVDPTATPALNIPIPLGANTLFITYLDAQNGPFVTDNWGNKLEATSLEITVTMDQTRPTVTEVKVVDAQTMEVVFSEPVEQTTAEDEGNYTIKDSAGDEIPVQLATLDAEGKKVTLAFTAEALGGGTYMVEISGITDRAMIKNPMVPYSSTITVNDQVRPYVKGSKLVYDGTAKELKLHILFSEQMAVSTLSNKANYSKQGTPGWVSLGDADTVTPAGDGKSVTIVLKDVQAAPNVNDQVIRLAYVTDNAGNGLRSVIAIGTYVNADTHDNKASTQFDLKDDSVAIMSAEAISTKRIKVTFDNRLGAVGAEDFQVAIYDTATHTVGAKFDDVKVVAHTVNGDGLSEVTLELSSEVLKANAQTSANQAVAVEVVGNAKTRSYLGSPIDTVNVTFADVKDRIAPTVDTVNRAGNTVTITFTEELAENTFAATLNGFSVSSGKLTKVELNGADKRQVILTFEENVKANVTVTYTSVGIKDDAGNELASFSKLVP